MKGRERKQGVCEEREREKEGSVGSVDVLV